MFAQGEKMKTFFVLMLLAAAGCSPAIERAMNMHNTLTVRNRCGEQIPKLVVERPGPTLTFTNLDSQLSDRVRMLAIQEPVDWTLTITAFFADGQQSRTNASISFDPSQQKDAYIYVHSNRMIEVEEKMR